MTAIFQPCFAAQIFGRAGDWKKTRRDALYRRARAAHCDPPKRRQGKRLRAHRSAWVLYHAARGRFHGARFDHLALVYNRPRKPISSSVNGIATQAIAVSHALNSPALRGPSGLGAASAPAVTDSVRRLVGHGGLWSTCAPSVVAILDPLTGLAVRLAPVNVDGTIALMPDPLVSPSVVEPPASSHAPLATTAAAARVDVPARSKPVPSPRALKASAPARPVICAAKQCWTIAVMGGN